MAVLGLVGAAGVSTAWAVDGPVLEALKCPDRTLHYTLTLDKVGVLFEACKDQAGLRQGPYRYVLMGDGRLKGEGTFLDGKLEGLARAYDSEGRVIYTLEFERDRQVAFKLTPAGIEEIARQSSELLRQDGRSIRVYANHDGGLSMEVRLADEKPDRPITPAEAQEIRRKSEAPICKVLRAIPEVPVISTRMLWIDGAIASTETFRPSQCPSIQPKAGEP